MYRDQKKRKEGGTRKGAREQALAPKEWSATETAGDCVVFYNNNNSNPISYSSCTERGAITRAHRSQPLPRQIVPGGLLPPRLTCGGSRVSSVYIPL